MQGVEAPQTTFIDRRSPEPSTSGLERRQFSPSYNSDRPEVNELARAIDQYKVQHRRRFITFEELYDVMLSLGYQR
ncbi:MAG: hypothetical protein R3C01_08930 [Planctomycetaceae bacterium]